MRARRAILTTLAVALLMPIAGGAASADVEWCDSGSPPPNDFRFRMTGAASATSSLSWLKSTTSGELDLEAGINTLRGGVARGMWTALLHARSFEESQGKHLDAEGDNDDEDNED